MSILLICVVVNCNGNSYRKSSSMGSVINMSTIEIKHSLLYAVTGVDDDDDSRVVEGLEGVVTLI